MFNDFDLRSGLTELYKNNLVQKAVEMGVSDLDNDYVPSKLIQAASDLKSYADIYPPEGLSDMQKPLWLEVNSLALKVGGLQCELHDTGRALRVSGWVL